MLVRVCDRHEIRMQVPKNDVADDETLLILSIRVVHDRFLISAYMNKGAGDDRVL